MAQDSFDVATLRDEIFAGRLGRRAVLRRALALGLSAPVIAGLLAACGEDDGNGSDAGTTATQATSGSGAGDGAAGTGATDATSETGDSTASPASEGGSTGEVAGQGRGTGELLRLLYWQAPTILNPHFAQGDKDSHASRLVLEPLANIDTDGNLIPELAAEIPSLENGGVAADGLSVTWKLKEGVVWSDGEPFTAEDVKFTWEYVTNTDTASTTYATYAAISSIDVVDDLTVTLNFDEPNPAWYTAFCGGYGGQVLPKHILESFVGTEARNAGFNLKPIGTGPYQVTEFRPGDTVLYEINQSYRVADKPFFAQVELKGGGDPTSAARAAIQTGETDFAWNLQVEKQVIEQMQSDDTPGEVVVVPGVSVEQILINFADPNTEVDGARSEPTTQHPFLSDKVVRQAFALATDRETIATQLYGQSGTATANTLVAPTDFASPNTTVEFDLDAAKALLEEAGWTGDPRGKDGTELSLVYSTTINPIRQKTQEIVKQSWEELGASVELKSIDAGVYFSSDAGNPDTVGHFYADVTMYTNGPVSPYPVDYMAGFKSNEPETDIAQQANQWSGANYGRWVSEEFNALWLEARTELDRAKQAELFIAMNDLVVNEVVRIGLVHRQQLRGINRRLRGITPSAWEADPYDIANWYFEEE